MHEPPGILEERLRACLQDHYDLAPVTLEFLPRGGDNALDVCLRSNRTEETRAEIARKFHESLGPGGSNLKAAFEASAHLAI